MKLDPTDMLYALSFATDKAETELIGLDTGHCKRVACLGILMGKEAGFRDDELRDFAGCFILHDNALTEKRPYKDEMPHERSELVFIGFVRGFLRKFSREQGKITQTC